MFLRNRGSSPFIVGIICIAFLGISGNAFAVTPTVKTVPWVASNSLIPHDTWSGKAITLKGTSDQQGDNFAYAWDFGDGSPLAMGIVTNKYAIEALHAYSGTTGTVFTAWLTVIDTDTGDWGKNKYLVQIQDKKIKTETNVAIDEGLWYIHKCQERDDQSLPGTQLGYWWDYWTWDGSNWVENRANAGYPATTAANINAFEVNGHLESGDPGDPYTETVQRGMRQLLWWLYPIDIDTSQTTGLVDSNGNYIAFNPDTNGNGKALHISSNSPGYFGDQGAPWGENYQMGMLIDAIVASGTPDAVANTGFDDELVGHPHGVFGRKYKDIVQDMVDFYLWGQHDSYDYGGGWGYMANGYYDDNSVSQWAAIGLIPAQRGFGIAIPEVAKDWNKVWLQYDQSGDGSFGYSGPGDWTWGPNAVTPSGMVQLAMDGIGRGPDSLHKTQWDFAETFMRDRWDQYPTSYGAYYSPRTYYYGLFSLVKSMLLHDSNGDDIAEPLDLLQSYTPGVAAFDWYLADSTNGVDFTDGVARTLVNDQDAAGFWYGHSYSGEQDPFNSAWAIIMLNKTIFQAGAPVAVATATPSPAIMNSPVTFNGTGSFHQDPSKSIVKWEWDFDDNGTIDAIGPIASNTYSLLGTYKVKLIVTDDAGQPATAAAILEVIVSIPPLPPTANAGGPYNFCLIPSLKLFLDGTKSVNPDDGQKEHSGLPGDFIKSYAWDLDGSGDFLDAIGAQPNVTNYFAQKGTGTYLIQLLVTDNSAISFPTVVGHDLTSTASAQVVVRAANDPACACDIHLTSYAKSKMVQLTWTAQTGADHYNIYRSTVNGGPYSKIGVGTQLQTVFFDNTVSNGTTYYYVIRPASIGEVESCQSNQVSALPRGR
jgi:hypothetical protein